MIDLSYLVGYFLLGILGWLAYRIYIWPYYISPLRKIPGPPSDSIFIGNIKSIYTEEDGEPYFRWVKKYGSILKYHGFLNRTFVMISDTKIIQDIVLNQVYDFSKPSFVLADLTAILGKGLPLVEGETHKRQRKVMTPAFSHNNIKEMVPAFIRVALTLKDIIEDKVDKGESKIILTSYISKATLDVIGLIGFNYEFNSLTSQDELAKAYNAISESNKTVLGTSISILSNYIPIIRKIPISVNNEFNNAVKVIKRVSKNLIEERYNEAKANKLNGKDLLSLMVNINQSLPIEKRMSDEELTYQIMTLLFAGHETTSVAMNWALHLLAQHPNEQNLLREELVKVFPDKSNFNPTFDEINSLEYLNGVTKETLRMIPPLTAFFRSTTKDKILGGYFIPKGTPITVPILTLHRLPSIWGPTADNFDPKRWLNPSLIKDVTNLNYLPFLTGTRSCIGSKVATTEFKILLSILIRNFVFQPVEGLYIRKKHTAITCKPDPYVELIVSKVEA